jgi:hypothetical protein
MRRNSRSAAFLLALLPALAPGQDAVKPGSVEGVVVNGITGEPIAHARVTLNVYRGSSAPVKEYGAITGEDGKFSWSTVAPNGYSLSVEMRGFIQSDGRHGVLVMPGSATHELKLQLVPEAILSGRVLDSHGAPLEGAAVLALYGGIGDHRATTDDRGEFRLTGLPAGKYLVLTRPPEVRGPAEIRTDGTKEECHAPTWYPNASVKSEAAPVEVTAGAQIGGIEIRLVRIPIVRVSGTVTGVIPRGMAVMASAEDGSSSTASEIRGGKFEIWRLAPGKYGLTAQGRTADSAEVRSYPMPLEIADANNDGLALEAIPEFEVAGQVEWDGTPPPADQRNEAWVHLGFQYHGKIEADGSFRTPHAVVGKQRVDLTGMPKTVYIKSIRLGQDQMPDGDLDLRNDPKGTPVTLLLSTAGAEISGVVKRGDGPAANVLVCAAPDRENARCEHGSQSGADGTFTVRGLAPGRYRLSVNMGDGQPNAYPVEVVEVQEGEKTTRDLTVAR